MNGSDRKSREPKDGAPVELAAGSARALELDLAALNDDQ
jgi:hypothetical protein